MKALVIGSNGYFGTNLVSALKKDGIHVTGVGSGENNISNADRYMQLDITDANAVSHLNFDVDVVYILASKNGTTIGFDNYSDFIKINEIGLLNILNEMVRQKSTAKVVYPSSRLVYEGSEYSLKEDGKLRPKTIYAETKVAAENYLAIYSNRFGIRYSVFRIGIPYGGYTLNDSPNVTIGFMIESARRDKKIPLYGGGDQKRTFTNMQYICDVFIEVLKNDKFENGIFNIGGEVFSLYELAEVVSKEIPATVNSVPWPSDYALIETGSTILNDEKLKSVSLSIYSGNIRDWIKLLIEK